MRTQILTLAACLCLAGSALADPVIIDFEGLSSMPYPSSSLILPEARLSDAFASVGVTFASGAPYVAVVDLGVGHETSGVLGIGGSQP